MGVGGHSVAVVQNCNHAVNQFKSYILMPNVDILVLDAVTFAHVLLKTIYRLAILAYSYIYIRPPTLNVRTHYFPLPVSFRTFQLRFCFLTAHVIREAFEYNSDPVSQLLRDVTFPLPYLANIAKYFLEFLRRKSAGMGSMEILSRPIKQSRKQLYEYSVLYKAVLPSMHGDSLLVILPRYAN